MPWSDIFPTPLLRFDVADAAKLNRSLLKEIATRQAAEGGMIKSNRKGWHSDRDLFDRKEPAQAALAQLVLRMMAQATKAFAPHTKFDNLELLADGWINVNPRRGYNAPARPCRQLLVGRLLCAGAGTCRRTGRH